MMKQLIYLEIPTPNLKKVRDYLQNEWSIKQGQKIITNSGIRLTFSDTKSQLAIFVWSLQRTTYLKVFQWGNQYVSERHNICQQLKQDLERHFPNPYPTPPDVNLEKQSIFEALETSYPETVKFFRKMPRGEYDLQRVYWWEKRWRESVNNPQQPQQVIFKDNNVKSTKPTYDLIYIGGALGAIHAVAMASLGYKVLLVERLKFGRMNREWNISRSEFQSLINLGLFTAEEFESIIATEYLDGFSKFFDGNNPSYLKSDVLHTPTVLNIAIDSDRLLRLCAEKMKQLGVDIWEETEFIRGDISGNQVTVFLKNLLNKEEKQVTGRLLIDAMGTASPIAWQLNGGQTFNSVCPTVGAVIDGGFTPEIWDRKYGDVLFSHGDISRGRQLIWELFPGENNDVTIYLFHYHQVHPDNPGSLLEMYEDFFTILPEYRRCEMDELIWKKPTFGYIPGHFSTQGGDRTVAFDRLVAIGDAASLQSPLVFTGFGSLVRNLPRLTSLLDTALKHDLLNAENLNQIRAYQSNTAVTWLFSKGMMVATGKTLPPERINSMLNTFFGLLANEQPEVAETFIKDRTNWTTFNKLALKAAYQNPALLWWIWEMAGTKDILRWLVSYFFFTLDSFIAFLTLGWLPNLLTKSQSWLENHNPALWLKLLSFTYTLQLSTGKITPLRTSQFR
jgi:lycopene cyclase CruA